MEIVDRVPGIKEARARSFSRMCIRLGERVLDVGCGIGTAVGEMAALVGPGGVACGVDISKVMIAEATARIQGRNNVEFSIGGAYALPYADATFDAVRMERVLLYVTDREKAIAEM